MKHLIQSDIALASRGELSLVAGLRAKAHCVVCAPCREQMDLYRADQFRVRQAVDSFELPRAMNWNSIEGEIFGNIRLGLDVSEIGQSAGQKRELSSEREISWRGAVAVAAMTVIVMTGWFLGGPGKNTYMRHTPSAVAQVRSGAVVLKGDESGVGVENRGMGLMLRHVPSPSSRFEVGLEGSVRSSAVDVDSGQVTVSQIYVE